MEYDSRRARLRLPVGGGRGDGERADVRSWPRPYLSNGHLELRPSLGEDAIDLPGTRLDASGLFDAGHVRFFFAQASAEAGGAAAVTHRLVEAELDMASATFEAEYEVLQESPTGGVPLARVRYEVFPLRQHPGAALQSFRVLAQEGVLMEEGVLAEEGGVGGVAAARLGFLHRVSTSAARPEWAAIDSVSSSVTLPPRQEAEAGGERVPIFTASGGEGSSLGAAAACAYLGDDPAHVVQAAGQRVRTSRHASENVLGMRGGSPAAPGSGDGRVEFRFHLLAVQARGGRAGVLRRLHALAGQGAAALRAEHLRRWAALWARGPEVVPKPHAPPSAGDAVHRDVGRHVRYAAYTLLSRASATGGAPLLGGLGVASPDLHLWTLPCLLLLFPGAVRERLRALLPELPAATRAARAWGLEGALFADGDGRPATEGASPRLLPSALVGLSAWDYYRSTEDGEWLRVAGFPLIRAAADLAGSAFRDGTLRASRGLDAEREAAEHDSLTVNVAHAVLRAALDASVRLGLPAGPAPRWTLPLRTSLPLFLRDHTRPFLHPTLRQVYRLDATHEGVPPAEPWIRVGEPLLLAGPLLPEVLPPLPRSPGERAEALRTNLRYYEPRLRMGRDVGSARLPLNAALLAVAHGVDAQRHAALSAEARASALAYAAYLRLAVRLSARGPWAALRPPLEPAPPGRPASDEWEEEAADPDTSSDTGMSALLLLVLLAAPAGVRIRDGGGDAAHTAHTAADGSRTGKMPPDWEGVRLGHSGRFVQNEIPL